MEIGKMRFRVVETETKGRGGIRLGWEGEGVGDETWELSGALCRMRDGNVLLIVVRGRHKLRERNHGKYDVHVVADAAMDSSPGVSEADRPDLGAIAAGECCSDVSFVPRGLAEDDPSGARVFMRLLSCCADSVFTTSEIQSISRSAKVRSCRCGAGRSCRQK